MADQATRWGTALRVLVGTGICAGLLALIAYAFQEPFVFPSVGPTIFILFFAAMSAQAAPRNVIYGQAIGLACGFIGLVAFGLVDVPPDLIHPSARSLGSAVLALCLTCFLMVGLGAVHGPAAATTLIVALGLIRTHWHLLVLLSAVGLVVVIGYFVNRMYGLRPPVWSPVDGAR